MLSIKGTNISMTRGDSADLTIQLKNDLGEQIDLVTGDTIYMTVKTSAMTETKLLQKVITSFIGGLATIAIAPADTSSLSFGQYKYDIQYKRADGFVRTIVPPSDFYINSEVTYE